MMKLTTRDWSVFRIASLPTRVGFIEWLSSFRGQRSVYGIRCDLPSQGFDRQSIVILRGPYTISSSECSDDRWMASSRVYAR